MKEPNGEKLIFVVPASNHFMFRCRSCDEMMSFMMDNDYKTVTRHDIWYIHIYIHMRIVMLDI